MQYLTYNEYFLMGGKISESSYPQLEFKARKQLDYYTSNRLSKEMHQREVVKMLIYELINLANSNDAVNKKVTSVSNNGVSESYATFDNDSYKSTEIKLVKQYLSGEVDNSGVLLLYVGV